ncbi:LysR family transcriptional regulator [Acinetobacter populi]|uniref:HTH lysR-type domain-containing protein n=1 Tax=Acinetobacter populi TaxID=1582270 RepID=A0A1Z9YZL4_9GAMM|nr:LysR family transcriptional regulator [Acinetobacter populi]OUY07617.1 hypothetical protein CAP51_07675 [Acinetobacter populi]
MKLEDIEAFVTFVDLQNTSLAAKKLNISQPAITKRIQNLEQDVGLILFDRTSRPLKLTQNGIAVYEQCQQINQQIRQFNHLLMALKTEQNSIRIGIATSIADISLNHIMAYKNQHYPQLKFEISTGWSTDLVELFAQNKLDIVILTTTDIPGIQQDQHLHSIAKLNIVPVITQKLKKTALQTLQDCQRLGWILNHEGCGYRAYLGKILAEHQLSPNIKVEITGSKSHMELIAQGHGIGLMPRQLLEYSEYAHQLVALDMEGFPFDSLLYAKVQQHADAACHQILEDISQQLRGILGLV